MGLISLIVAIITMIVLIWTLVITRRNFKIELLKDTFISFLNDIKSFENNLPSIINKNGKLYDLKIDSKVYRINGKTDYPGIENFRQQVFWLIGILEQGNSQYFEIIQGNKVNPKFEKIWDDMNYTFSIYFYQYCFKLSEIINLANEIQEITKSNKYRGYVNTISNTYQKFLIAFYYRYDSNFPFKHLLEKENFVHEYDLASLLISENNNLKILYKELKKVLK